jgi:hypothetical protein
MPFDGGRADDARPPFFISVERGIIADVLIVTIV